MKKWIFLAILIAVFITVPFQDAFSAARQDKAVTAGGGKAYYEIYDEDTMSSDDAYGLATQQSIKAYIDNFAIDSYTQTTDVLVSGSSAFTWAFNYGNTLFVSGTSPLAVSLPEITSTYKGYRLLIKQKQGSNVITVSPYTAGVSGSTDYIETISGVTEGTSDATIVKVGDWRMWIADMDSSGITGYWRLVADGVCDSFDRFRRSPVTLTEVAGVGYTISPSLGNVFLIPTSASDGNSLQIPGGTAGVTVVIPQVTASNVGWEPTIVNTTGTSPFVLYIDGTEFIGASGVTIIYDADASGDSYTLGYYASGETVYVKSKYIN